MKLISIVIFIFGILIFIGAYHYRKKKLLSKEVTALFYVICFMSILISLFPNASSIFAKTMGVDRGADSIVYIAIILFTFLLIKLMTKISELDKKISYLVREDAKRNAIKSKTNKSKKK